jgi:hypothetical protein
MSLWRSPGKRDSWTTIPLQDGWPRAGRPPSSLRPCKHLRRNSGDLSAPPAAKSSLPPVVRSLLPRPTHAGPMSVSPYSGRGMDQAYPPVGDPFVMSSGQLIRNPRYRLVPDQSGYWGISWDDGGCRGEPSECGSGRTGGAITAFQIA